MFAFAARSLAHKVSGDNQRSLSEATRCDWNSNDSVPLHTRLLFEDLVMKGLNLTRLKKTEVKSIEFYLSVWMLL